MKISIEPADLKEAIRFALTAVDSRPTSPIMGGVLLNATEDQLTASGSNYISFASLKVPAQVDTPGEVLLNGVLLGQAVSKFKRKTPVLITVEGKRAHLSQGATKFELAIMPARDYPGDLNGNPELIGTINGEDLSRIIATTHESATSDEALPVLTGVNLALEETITATATDRYRIALDGTPWEPVKPISQQITVSANWLRVVGKTAAGETDLYLSHDKDGPARFGIKTGEYLTSIALIQGDYPKVRPFFTNHGGERYTVSRSDLIDATDAVSVMAERNVPVIIERDETGLTVSSGRDEGESSVTLETDNDEPFKIGMNPGFLMAALRALDSKEIIFEVSFNPNGVAKPIHIAPTEGEAAFLVMPVRLSQ